MRESKFKFASIVAAVAALFAGASAQALYISGVTASASSFDTLGYEGYGVFSSGGQQLIPGSFGGFGSAEVGAVRDEFIRGPWKMVDNSGLRLVSPGDANTNPTYYHIGNSYLGYPDGNPFWLSLDGPLNGSKTVDIYPSRAAKDIVTPADGTRYTFGPDTAPVLIFDLGGVYDLTSFHVWNWCEAYADDQGNITGDGTARGVRDITISYSTDGVNYSGSIGRRLPRANAFQVVNNTYLGADLTLALNGVRFVRFDVRNNYSGDLANTNVPAGIAEIKFNGTPSVVPEPASATFLALPALALVRRRRA